MTKKKDRSFTKQHIVPKAYLNHFSTPGRGKNKFLIGVRQNDLKHYIDSTDNVGYQKDYYDDAEYPDDKKHWEHFYATEIEAPCLRTISNLIAKVTLSSDGNICLTNDEKYDLSKFIIAQFLRVPDFIDYQIDNAQNKIFLQHISEFLRTFDHLLSEQQKNAVRNIRFTDDQVKHLILSNINDLQKLNRYCEILISKPWVVYINRYYNEMPFITSDNPVVMTNLRTKSFSRSDNGLGNQNTVIFFPINPYIAIGIYPHQFRDSLRHWESKELICSEKDISFITTMNTCVISQCHNQAFVPVYFYETIYKEAEPQ